MQWKGARKPTPTKPDSYRFQQKSLQLQALFLSNSPYSCSCPLNSASGYLP